LQNFVFTTSIVAPVFLIVFLGTFLKKRKIITDDFIRTAPRVVFQITLPSLVFLKISTTDFARVLNPGQVIYAYIGLTAMYIWEWFVAFISTKDGGSRGAFIQGSFRSNFAIIGLALINNALGPEAMAQGAILLAFIMPMYNLYSILALTIPLHKEKQISFRKTLFDIVTNPLIIAAMIALPFSIFRIHIPQVIIKTIKYLADLTLPLALLSIGGSLSFTSIKNDFKLAALSALHKIVLMPLILVFAAYRVGFRGVDLAVLFFLFSAPSAIASFVMAEAMGSNGKLAGNIVLLTTLGSLFTITIGLFLMKGLGIF